MSRIKIKNFGPIKEPKSVKDEWIDIKKVTVFTGNQGLMGWHFFCITLAKRLNI